MDIQTLIPVITVLVTLVCGVISKKSKWVDNNLIPVQNLAIGLIIAIVDYIITKDFNAAITVSGLMAGGLYDLVNNSKKIFNKEEK